jgi:SPP1 gp7 family putative phage head morphogenesis protein
MVDPFALPPEETVRWFQAKGYRISDDWRDTWAAQHARAFTVARVSQLDLLADIRESVDRAISEGVTLRQFSNELRPRLVERGWWGERTEVDPQTGEERTVQLGSPQRLRTIFQANLAQAQAAGRWERMQRTKATRPYGRYVAILDGRARAEHLAWHGTVLPLDHEWWDTHAPPNGWGCRCTIQQLSDRDLERYGYEVNAQAPPSATREWVNQRTGERVRVPKGIDPGFDYNPGTAPRGDEPDAPAEPLAGSPGPRDYGLPPGGALRPQSSGPPPLPPDDRARAFRELWGIPEEEETATVTDARGEQLVVSTSLLDHPGAELAPLARETVMRPTETWLTPVRLPAGRVVMRQVYVGLYDDDAALIAHRDEHGRLRWRSVPRGELDAHRRGYLLPPPGG